MLINKYHNIILLKSSQNLILLLGIVGIFSGIGLVEDAFADYEIGLSHANQESVAKLMLKFYDPVDITNGTNGFELLKSGELKDFSVGSAKHSTWVKVQIQDGTYNSMKDSYTITYDGSSNNLQHDGKSILSFTYHKEPYSTKWKPVLPPTEVLFTPNNSTIIQTTIKEGEIYQNPSWYFTPDHPYQYRESVFYIDENDETIFLDQKSPLPTGNYTITIIPKVTLAVDLNTLSVELTVVDGIEPTFSVMKNGKIYSEPQFYTYLDNPQSYVEEGTIIDIEDESSTYQNITRIDYESGVKDLIYGVTDEYGNTSTITETLFYYDYHLNNNHYAKIKVLINDEFYEYEKYNDFTITNPIQNPMGYFSYVNPVNSDYSTVIVTIQDANDDSIYYINYNVIWPEHGYFWQITETVYTDGVDSDLDGILDQDDDCKLRYGYPEYNGCPIPTS